MKKFGFSKPGFQVTLSLWSVLLFVLLPPTLTSCDSSEQNQSDVNGESIAETTDSSSNSDESGTAQSGQLEIFCFYGLDDKTSTETDATITKDWLTTRLKAIANGATFENFDLFSHNGGGPNGSQWNPASDIYIIAHHPDCSVKDSTHQLLVNGINISSAFPMSIWKMAQYYRLDLTQIEKLLRPMKVGESSLVYSPEYLEEVRNGTRSMTAEKEIGEVLRFDAICNADTTTKFFHASYGE